MKKKLVIILIAIILLLVSIFVACGIYYKNALKPVGNKEENVILEIDNGMTSKNIIDLLYDANLIKDKYAGYIYLKLNKNISLQAGNYDLNRGMSFEEIIKALSEGSVINDSISVTFVEGKRITYFASQISKKFAFTEEEIINKLNDKEYLQELIEKYWFLTDDILNDKLYYPLEGYLYPDTYQFEKDSTIEEIIEKILDHTNKILKQYQDQIESRDKKIHEILTMASIVELEGVNSHDRMGVAGVFYNRLNSGWSLGSDVTTYYGAKIEMSDRDLYQYEIETVNDYNTRPSSMAGKLPIGPICNPGEESIKAAIAPETHDYYYFVADKNKKTYFNKTYDEHIRTINELKSSGLWYEY